MKKAFWAFGILAFLGTTSAMAADVVPPAPAFNWAGPYVGVVGSYGFGTSNHTNAVGLSSGDFGMSGILGGLDFGFNRQSNNFVYGLEGDIALSTDKGNSRSGVCGGGGCDTNLNWLSTARARVGFAKDNFLFFGTGGLAIAGMHADCCASAGSVDSTRLGYTLGGGIEMAVSNHMTAKLQYLYVNEGSIPYQFTVNADASRNHIVSLGINYKF
ncbi:MAG TPA: outer membrane beta-barrel protein [Aestuariivirga sp.]